MTRTEIQTALTEVGQAVAVPPIDRVDFQARVRAERRRRTTARALAATGVAAAVVTAVGVALSGTVGGADDSSRVTDGAVAEPGADGLRETVWFVRDGELTALDPTGRLHDLGVASEGVVGFTSERVYALDDESRLVVRAVTYAGESRVASFVEETSPVAGAVSSVALSGDGRYLGWLDLAGTARRLDLKAGRVDLRVEVGANSAVTSVGADGLLVSEDGELSLLGDADGTRVPVPVQGDGYGVASDVAMGRVLVQDRDGASRLYDVSGGSARLEETFDGSAELGPYAERVAVLAEEAGDGSGLTVWDGEVLPVTGIGGRVEQVRWADETTLLVSVRGGDGPSLYACDLDLRCSVLPVEGEVGLG